MNHNFKDLLEVFSRLKVRYLIIGGYAVIRHAEPRYTKDIDLWVEPTEENSNKVYQALIEFGAPVSTLTAKDFSQPGFYFTMGMPPQRIDILFDAKGLKFEECWKRRLQAKLGEIDINYIGLDDLIVTKKAVARFQDLADVEKLEAAKKKA